MNFITMKDRIAKATTSTVKVFKSLDEMAANDEYVHSDGLNVKRREPHRSSSSSSKHQRAPRATTSTPTSTSAPLHHPPPDYDDMIHDRNDDDDVVYNVPPNKTSSTTSIVLRDNDWSSRDTLIYYNTSSSSFQDDEGRTTPDPILPMFKRTTIQSTIQPARTSIQTHDNDVSTTTTTTTTDVSTNTIQTQQPPQQHDNTRHKTISPKKKNKDPNRFLTELDARISKPMTMMETTTNLDQSTPNHVSKPFSLTLLPSSTSTSNNSSSSSSSTSDKFHWLGKNLPNSLLQYIPQASLIMGQSSLQQLEHGSCSSSSFSLSTTKGTPQQQQKNNILNKNDNDDELTWIQSDAILGECENDELLRIRQRMNRNVMTVVWNILDKNRQYVGIMVTFVVMMVGYFWMRHKMGDGVF